MLRKLDLSKAALLSVILTIPLLLLVGCSKEQSPAAAPPVAAGDGKAVFSAKCAGCHTLGGVGGKKGPDLTKVGATAEHTAEWLTAFIKNPKSKDPGSRMPPFEGKIPDADIQAVGTYLASQK